MPMIGKPGNQREGSSIGFVLLAEIVRRVTGRTIEEFVIKTFFEPLGMTDSYYDIPVEKRNRVVVVVENDENMEEVYGVQHGANGIYTTTNDLIKFSQMFLNEGLCNEKHILSRKTVERLCTEICWEGDGKSGKCGLGFGFSNNDDLILSHGVLGTGGSGWAGASELMIDQNERFVWAHFAAFENWIPDVIDHTKNIVWSGIK